MNLCPNCGIELEPGYAECPLCLARINGGTSLADKSPDIYPSQDRPLSNREKLHLFWEVSGILHFSSIVMTILIDIIMHKKPGWSLISTTAIAASFVYITLLVYTTRHLLVFLGGLLLNTLALLFILDELHTGINWFFMPALPLTGFFILMLGLVLLFTRNTKQKGFNIIAIISLAIGVYIMIIEMTVSYAAKNVMSLSWSVIVAASILPFALILLYFHYRLKRGTSLRKFFNL